MRPRVVQNCARVAQSCLELLRVVQSCPELLRVAIIQTKTNGGWTDGPTDRWMDTPSYRDARTHLKSVKKLMDLVQIDQEMMT